MKRELSESIDKEDKEVLTQVVRELDLDSYDDILRERKPVNKLNFVLSGGGIAFGSYLIIQQMLIIRKIKNNPGNNLGVKTQQLIANGLFGGLLIFMNAKFLNDNLSGSRKK